MFKLSSSEKCFLLLANERNETLFVFHIAMDKTPLVYEKFLVALSQKNYVLLVEVVFRWMTSI